MLKLKPPEFKPKRIDYESEVRRMFDAMPIHQTLGMQLTSILPGQVSAAMPLRHEISQHHGAFHAGALITLADCVCGCAAWSLIESGQDLVSSNITASMLRLAKAETVRADGYVIKAGSRLYFCEARISDLEDTDSEKPLCIVQVTIAVI